MSAFAARQQLWGAAAARVGSGRSSDEKATDTATDKATAKSVLQPAPEDDATPRPRRTRSETPSSRPVAGRTTRRQPTEEPAAAGQTQAQAEAQMQGIDPAGEDETAYVGFFPLSTLDSLAAAPPPLLPPC